MNEQRSKGQTIALWIVSALVGLAFLPAGGAKLAGAEQMVQNFAHWGFPPWFLTVVGLLEVGGAILTLIPGTRFYGALLLGGTMAGALGTHVRAGEYAMAAPSVVLGLLCAILAWSYRPAALRSARA